MAKRTSPAAAPVSSTQPPDAAGAKDDAATNQSASNSAAQAPSAPLPWHEFIRSSPTNQDISARYIREAVEIFATKPETTANTCVLTIFDTDGSIGDYQLDAIYRALLRDNPNKDKDVTLFLLSNGGAIHPAYQISKICKAFTATTFRVVVPRFAKSAATLIATGADEIHMGPLSQLGPIDPQIGGLPALGVARALSTIAEVAQQYPGSAEMFATYLRQALTVEQIGYCERISESAEQYATRLLQTKPSLASSAPIIAKELVREYKHHGFVIDLEEAQSHLGSDWVKANTDWAEIGEKFYELFDTINFFLGWIQKKRMVSIGAFYNTFIADKE